MRSKSDRVAVALLALVIAASTLLVVRYLTKPAAGSVCGASNASAWKDALHRQPYVVGLSRLTQFHLGASVDGHPLVPVADGDRVAVQLWDGTTRTTVLTTQPGRTVDGIDAAEGWVVMTEAVTAQEDRPGRRVVAVELSTHRQVVVGSLPRGERMDAAFLFDGSVWWSTHTATTGHAHRYDLATGRATVPFTVSGHFPELLHGATGIVWRKEPSGNGELDLTPVVDEPLPPPVAAAFGDLPTWVLRSDGRGYAWGDGRGVRWWQPGMTEVASVPGDEDLFVTAMSGPFLVVNYGEEAATTGVLDARTGARTRIGGGEGGGAALFVDDGTPNADTLYRLSADSAPTLRCSRF